MMRFAIILIIWVIIETRVAQAAKLYSFPEAADRGMVDLGWTTPDQQETDALISHLPELKPGIVNRFASFWGGPTQERIDHAARLGAKILIQLPHALLDASVPEGIAPTYKTNLECDHREREFSAADLTSGKQQAYDSIFLDLAKPQTGDFYVCIGKMFIDRGFTVLHFEAPSLLLKYATSRTAAIASYRRVHAELVGYAHKKGIQVYFSGDEELSKIIALDAVYVPSRFFHFTVPTYLKYQNKIENRGVGVGYYYALSPNIVADVVRNVPRSTAVFFYIDNWDPQQDDLRRMMELDAVNRRNLIIKSAQNARSGGAHFVPSLDHCLGCVDQNAVVDPCEILPDGHTEYNALRCDDLASIAEALKESRGAR